MCVCYIVVVFLLFLFCIVFFFFSIKCMQLLYTRGGPYLVNKIILFYTVIRPRPFDLFGKSFFFFFFFFFFCLALYTDEVNFQAFGTI